MSREAPPIVQWAGSADRQTPGDSRSCQVGERCWLIQTEAPQAQSRGGGLDIRCVLKKPTAPADGLSGVWQRMPCLLSCPQGLQPCQAPGQDSDSHRGLPGQPSKGRIARPPGLLPPTFVLSRSAGHAVCRPAVCPSACPCLPVSLSRLFCHSLPPNPPPLSHSLPFPGSRCPWPAPPFTPGSGCPSPCTAVSLLSLSSLFPLPRGAETAQVPPPPLSWALYLGLHPRSNSQEGDNAGPGLHLTGKSPENYKLGQSGPGRLHASLTPWPSSTTVPRLTLAARQQPRSPGRNQSRSWVLPVSTSQT